MLKIQLINKNILQLLEKKLILSFKFVLTYIGMIVLPLNDWIFKFLIKIMNDKDLEFLEKNKLPNTDEESKLKKNEEVICTFLDEDLLKELDVIFNEPNKCCCIHMLYGTTTIMTPNLLELELEINKCKGIYNKCLNAKGVYIF